MPSTSAQHLEEADAYALLTNLVHPWFLSLRNQQKEVLDELQKRQVKFRLQMADRLEKRLKVFIHI